MKAIFEEKNILTLNRARPFQKGRFRHASRERNSISFFFVCIFLIRLILELPRSLLSFDVILDVPLSVNQPFPVISSLVQLAALLALLGAVGG